MFTPTKQLFNTVFFIFLSITLICFSTVSVKSEDSQSTPVNFNKIPMAGQDAFWAHNPLNPQQKILFVPSKHDLNLRFIRKHLMNPTYTL